MDILKLAEKEEQYVIDMRRKFHRHPEVGGTEEHTMEIIKKELEKFGIEYEVVERGGIVGKLKGSKEGKRIILRADIDALPMQEDPNNIIKPKTCVSEIDGVAHMCGHDGHTAMLLGAAKILSENKDLINGEIVFAFEQGEEIGYGLMIVEHLRQMKADGVWGIHLQAETPSGKISVDPGPRMAVNVTFEIEIGGKGGHGSRPDLANNPLDCFADVYNSLKDMRLNKLDPFFPTTFSVGYVKMGDAPNIIPENLTFGASLRHTDHEEIGSKAEKYIRDILNDTCKLHNCTYKFIREPKSHNILTYNNEDCSKIAAQSVVKALGEDALYQRHPWMGGESMAFYMQYFPGVFAFLGIGNEEKGTGAGHHNPHFDIDEDVLKLGAAATVQYAIDFLNSDDKINFTASEEDITTILKRIGF
ncbi:amidohydrolase [Dethiosulfatibacter aminovorans DSM 17477]|uniref:Amidohydrolase n=1 Tax=Dethiosulfatibacter aminovorans DSM 17477 TaxID=1121476 RepID=A0A1M6JP51_9FIRM|nr:amidohydrolase [Dethiosulfatibacter aminovorans]SHJ48416.1 amidohydrolase [Dethiosulfatibacter aminovorans DSM 17477]